MVYLFTLFVSVFSLVSFAGPVSLIKSEQVSVCNTWNDGETARVFLCDGRVIKATSDAQFKEFEMAQVSGAVVELNLATDFSVKSIQTLGLDKSASGIGIGTIGGDIQDFSNYSPTVIEVAQANRLFRNMNTTWRMRSQCYQRAMAWTYDSFQDEGIRSQKAFLFFTQKYIRDYDYKWWFHVAPLYTFKMLDESIVDLVLDRTFFSKPEKIKDWTDGFIKSRQNCPVVQKYSDYSQHQWDRHCYLFLMPMHYYQPADIQALEEQNVQITGFREANINHAFRGFRRR